MTNPRYLLQVIRVPRGPSKTGELDEPSLCEQRELSHLSREGWNRPDEIAAGEHGLRSAAAPRRRFPSEGFEVRCQRIQLGFGQM